MRAPGLTGHGLTGRDLAGRVLRLAALLLAGSALVLTQFQPAPLQAQSLDTAVTGAPATLVADSLRLEGRDRLIAEGNVEALSGATRLKA